ncbi:MAG: hypothetical protein IKC32_05975 [Clostridia bacterium]|nr:hypothetical protein [Clostridia bacterium]
MREIKDLRLDRMRYTNNAISATLCYLAILLDALYFVSIYSSDVGNYYYSMTIGVSVVYNLVFLLVAFLCSEGVKNYAKLYGYVSIAIGVLQLVRILGIPLNAFTSVISYAGEELKVMELSQFIYVTVLLVLSAMACCAAGAICLTKSYELDAYRREIGVEK